MKLKKIFEKIQMKLKNNYYIWKNFNEFIGGPKIEEKKSPKIANISHSVSKGEF